MTACKRLAASLLGMIVIFACGAANAAITSTTYGPFSITCTGGVQLCNATFSQVVSTAGTLQVQYNASTGHCSNVRVHILVDGIEKAVTAFLTPGQASGFFNVGPVSAGSHTVALQGEGTLGGCNAGFLLNWGGTLDVMADTGGASVPIPTLDTSLLVLLGILLVATAAVARRS